MVLPVTGDSSEGPAELSARSGRGALED